MSVSPIGQFSQTFTSRELLRTRSNDEVDEQNAVERRDQQQQQIAESSESEQSRNDTEHTPEEKRQIEQLQQRDQEVRAHEQAHRSAAGIYARGGSFQYERGPDGAQYAVAGEVRIDISPVSGDPVATAQKADVVQRAALAPADPSPQDYRVAAEASQMAMQARAEIQTQKQQELAEKNTVQGDEEDADKTAGNNDPKAPGASQYQAVSEMHSDEQSQAALDFIA